MAAEDKIDSIIDRPAVTAEIDFLKKEVSEIVTLIRQTKGQSIDFNVNTKNIDDYNKKMAALSASMQQVEAKVKGVTAATTANTQATQQANGTLQQNVELRRRLQTSMESYNKSQKEDLALLKSGTITRAEYNKRITESQVKVDVYKSRIAELNRVIKEDIALEGKAGDAYKQLSAEYNRAALAAKNYQVTLGATHPTTITATANAKQLSDRLKEVDNSVGQNQRNVGNYSSALTAGFGKLWGFLRTAANIIPGLGIGGLIGGIVVGLGKLGSAIFVTEKGFDSAKVSAEAYASAIKEVNQAAASGSIVDTTKLELYRSILNDVTRSQEERTQALNAYNQVADKANQIDVSQLNNLTLINDKISTQISLIERRALSRAAEAILAEKGEALLLAKLEGRAKAEKETDQELIGIRAGSTERQIELDKEREIQTKLTRNETVRTRQVEFDAAKKALYSIISTEKFAAEEIKTTKEKKAKKTRDLAEAERQAQFEILKAQIELDKEYDLIRANDQKRTFLDRVQNLAIYGEDSQRLIEAQAAFELGKANLTKGEREKIELDKNNALIRLATELNEKLKAIREKDLKPGTDQLPVTARIPKELQKIMDDYEKAQKKAIDKAKKDAEELAKALKQAFETLATEVSGLFFDLFQNDAEREKNQIQDRIDLLEEQRLKDIELTNQTITNAQDRAAEIARINATADAKKRQLEQQQRQADQRKAQFEKAQAVAGIIQATSLAVARALPNIGLSIAVGAIGAIQLIRALSTPIPRYAEGTEDHPGGLMYVGDGGKSEGVELPDGTMYKTPSTATLVNAPKGTKVYSDYDKWMMNSTMTKTPVFHVKQVDNTQALKEVGRDIVKAVRNIPQPVLTTDGAWQKAMKQGSGFRTYLNKYL